MSNRRDQESKDPSNPLHASVSIGAVGNIYFQTNVSGYSQAIAGNVTGPTSAFPSPLHRTTSAPNPEDPVILASLQETPRALIRANTTSSTFTPPFGSWNAISSEVDSTNDHIWTPTISNFNTVREDISEIFEDPTRIDEEEDMSRQATTYNQFDQAIETDGSVQARPERMWWFDKGKVFKVQDDENRTLSNRAFVVLAQSRDNRLICLAFCEHTASISQAVRDIHVAVRETDGGPRPTVINSALMEVGLVLASHARLRAHVYLNLEHPYTVNIEDLKVIECGQIELDDVTSLITNHINKYHAMMSNK